MPKTFRLRRRHLWVPGCLSLVALGLACTENSSSPPVTPPDFDAAVAEFDAGSIDAAPAPVDANPDVVVDAGEDSAVVDGGMDAAVTTEFPFATGLDSEGIPAPDQSVDPHWTVKNALGVALTAYAQTDALGFPNYWMRPSETSKFISPFLDTNDANAEGPFTYTTTFSLRTGTDLGAVELVIKYASDNLVTGGALNAVPLAGLATGGYSVFEQVTLTEGFVIGTNTVEIVVTNTGGPTGLRAELTLTAN